MSKATLRLPDEVVDFTDGQDCDEGHPCVGLLFKRKSPLMLPFLAFLGHNAVHLLTGFLCLCWLKHEEEDEEEPSTVQKHSREG